MKQNGAEAYRAQLDGASGYFHWLADRARARFDMRSADGRMDAFKFLLPAVQKISDKLERAAVASDLAGYLGVEPGLVLDQFKRAAAERHAPGQVAAARARLRRSSNGAPRPMPAVERILVERAAARAKPPASRSSAAADAGADRRICRRAKFSSACAIWPRAGRR